MLVFPAWIYLLEILTSTYIYAVFSMFVCDFGEKIPLDNLKSSPAGFFGRAFIHLTASLIFSMICLYLSNVIAYQWKGEVYCKGCLGGQKCCSFLTVNGGLGLRNTEARLKQIYGENFSLNIANESEKGTCVLINIPFER